MSEQLALIDMPATLRLSERQQTILDAIHAAGPDGLDTDHVGALLHHRTGKHGPEQRCRWCGRDGKHILAGELRPKGLVRYRRGTATMPGGWVATGSLPITHPDEPPDHEGDGPVPYNAFPAGF